MKVLVFFDHDPGLYGILPSEPTQVVTGGYKRFLEIAKRIEKYDIEFKVVESSPAYPNSDRSLSYSYREFVTPALRFANARLTDPWLVAWKMARIGKRLIEKEPFDLIISPSESIEMCLAAFLTSHWTKIPWAAVVHHIDWAKHSPAPVGTESTFGTRYLVGFYSILHNSLNKWLLPYLYNSASIISVSYATEKSLRSLGVKSTVFICGNGIDTNQIDKVQTHESLFDGIFVGRLVRSKGLMEALEIFEQICSRDAKARFAIVGEGDPKIMRTLKEEIAKKKIEKNVKLFGYVGEEEKTRLMKSSKIFIYPSHAEGWGIVVAEALACGLPVICYDLLPFKEIFRCEAVRQCREGNVNQMIAETERLLESQKERTRLGFIGREFVRKFDWEKVAEREAQIYQLLIADSQKPRF